MHTSSDVHSRWGEAGALQMWLLQGQQSPDFGPFFQVKLDLLDLPPGEQAEADLSAHAITLLTKLYRLICVMPSQHRPFPT
jgi:hypothetical protein